MRHGTNKAADMAGVGTTITAFAAALVLCGCVSSPTGILNLSPKPLPPSSAKVNKSGDFPTFGNEPQKAAAQLSEAEKAQIKNDLATAASRGSEANAKRAEAEYKRDVAEMQKLIAAQERKRKSQ